MKTWKKEESKSKDTSGDESKKSKPTKPKK